MTLTLQNLIENTGEDESHLGSTNAQQFELLRRLPFYNWRANFDENHTQKTSSRRTYSTQNDTQTVISFNHAIGMPQKNGQVFCYPIMNRFYLIHCRSTNMSE